MRQICVIVFAAAVAAAQAPVISVDQPHFDFGKISADGKAVHRFKVANKGNAPLNISRLNPSCGCTSTVIGQWTLNPGQSTDVEATFNPSGFRGVVHKSIQVICNDPATPTLNLTFEAEVVREISPSTDAVFFQDLQRTSPRKSSVKFSSGNGQPVHLTEAKAPGAPYLSASIRPDGKDAWVDILIDGRQVPPGRLTGTDALVVRTDNAKVPTVNITIQWEIKAAIQAEPMRVAWVESAGKELRTKVVLKQVDGKPFRILSAKTTHSLLRVEGAGKGQATQHELQVVLAASAKAGMYNEKVILTTDSPEQPEVELRVAASLR
jgi:hypothetical protein